MKKLLLYTFAGAAILITGCKNETPQPVQLPKTGQSQIIDTTTYTLTAFLKEIVKKDDVSSLIIDSVDYMSIAEIRKIEESNIKIEKLEKAKETGFYLSNSEKLLKELKLNISTLYIMQTFSINKEGSFNFNERINELQFEHIVKTINNTRYKSIPFRITYKENTIIKLEEIYIP